MEAPVERQPLLFVACTPTLPVAANGSHSVNAPAPSVSEESQAPPAHAPLASRTRRPAMPDSLGVRAPSFATPPDPPPAGDPPSSRNTTPSTRLPCQRPKSWFGTSVLLTLASSVPPGCSVPIQPVGSPAVTSFGSLELSSTTVHVPEPTNVNAYAPVAAVTGATWA